MKYKCLECGQSAELKDLGLSVCPLCLSVNVEIVEPLKGTVKTCGACGKVVLVGEGAANVCDGCGASNLLDGIIGWEG